MQIFTPDNSSISSEAQTLNQRTGEAVVPTPDVFSPGMVFLAEIEMKAKAIYPDHGESRKAYIREMVVHEINRLHELVGPNGSGPR